MTDRREDDAAATEPAAWLAERLSARSSVMRLRASVDFTLIAALLRLGRPAAAAQAIEGHRRALQSYADDLSSLVAEATAREDAPVPASGGSDGHRASGPIRGVALAAVAALLVVPGARGDLPALAQPPVAEAGVGHLLAARERLSALLGAEPDARSVAGEVRALHAEILSLPPLWLDRQEVREEIDDILALEQRALNGLAGHEGAYRDLLEELRSVRAALALPPHLEVAAGGEGVGSA